MNFRIFGIGLALALAAVGPAAVARQELEILEQVPDLPGAPYFSWKTGLQLIQGSHSIAPLAPIRVGGTRQLLLDKYIVDSTWNCFRTVHAPERYSGNPVIKPVDDPKVPSGGPQYYASVFYDEITKRFRVWGANSDRGVYFESGDGFNWTAPKLNLVDWKGSKENNLFFGGDGYGVHSFSVIELPQRLRSKGRFALLYFRFAEGKRPETGHTSETRIAFSEDGIHFKDQVENPAIRGRSDTPNNLVYNPERDVFMMYRRATVNAHEIRRIAYSESKDLVTWTQPRVVLDPDELDAPMLYGMTVTRYQGVYLGFLQMFYSGNAGYSTGPRLYRDVIVDKEFHIDIQLAWSRDGIHWERHPGRPIFMKTGLYGTYDWGRVYVNHGVVDTGRQIYLYYRGAAGLHIKMPGNESTFCLATLRRDGFVSLDTPGTGYMLTRPLLCPGGKLRINARTDPGGFIRVAVRRGDGDADGQWLRGWYFDDGPVFSGDATDAVLAWNNAPDLSRLKDRTIRLHFWMEKAQLYSFGFAE
ncbi:MAG: hypothetical protein DMG07_06120 [Acidobacteria bacterium]|nr:MAG: hypothetical protein DMG07_06120 [Acidobacteriota bacterium]